MSWTSESRPARSEDRRLRPAPPASPDTIRRARPPGESRSRPCATGALCRCRACARSRSRARPGRRRACRPRRAARRPRRRRARRRPSRRRPRRGARRAAASSRACSSDTVRSTRTGDPCPRSAASTRGQQPRGASAARARVDDQAHGAGAGAPAPGHASTSAASESATRVRRRVRGGGLLARRAPDSTSAWSIPARRAPATSVSSRSPTASARPGPSRSGRGGT